MPEKFIDWVASYPKSGNTWVRTLLNAYYFQDYFNPNYMSMVQGEPPRSAYLRLWPCEGKWDLYDWACMRPLALLQAYQMRQHEHFVLKTHTANIRCHDMPMIPERLTRRAVYVVRDPRDVLVSGSKYFQVSLRKYWGQMKDQQNMHGKQDAGVTWQPCSSYEINLQSWLAETPFPVLRVRYEDMIADVRSEFVRILEFFGIVVDDEKVNKALEVSSFERMQAYERAHGFAENVPARRKNTKGKADSFFRVGKAGQWRDIVPHDLACEVYETLKHIEYLWSSGIASEPGSRAA